MYHTNPKPVSKLNESDRDVLKPAWKNFALRAQNVKRNNDNPAIVQMTVLINRDGNPALWTEPKVISLEPRLEFDVTSLKKGLSEEELLALLEFIATR